MARRRGEIALQAEIETQEEWEDMLAKEGVTGRSNLTVFSSFLRAKC